MLSMKENKYADQLCDLQTVFFAYAKKQVSHDAAYIILY